MPRSPHPDARMIDDLPLRRRAATALLLLLTTAACGDQRPAPPPAQGPDAAGAAASPQALDLTGVGFDLGAADAPVTVVEFSDFGCPYCAQFGLQSFPVLQQEFIQPGQVRWKYIPFALGIFPNGEEALRAGLCAAEQDRFWAMHDRLYERQREWRGSDDPEALFPRYADALGLDTDRFASCYRENRPAEQIEQHNEVARRAGVRATPSFLVDGRPVEGALPLEQFRALLQWAGSDAPAGGR